MCTHRIPTSSLVGCEKVGRGASCRSPAVQPAAMLVVCSAARCISPACARAPQHERRPRAMLTGMSSCTMAGGVVCIDDASAAAEWLRRARLCASHAAWHALPERHHALLRLQREGRRGPTRDVAQRACWAILHSAMSSRPLPSIHFSTFAFVSSKAARRGSDCSSSCITVGRWVCAPLASQRRARWGARESGGTLAAARQLCGQRLRSSYAAQRAISRPPARVRRSMSSDRGRCGRQVCRAAGW